MGPVNVTRDIDAQRQVTQFRRKLPAELVFHESRIAEVIKNFSFKAFFETSAKDGQNVQPVFEILIKEGFEYYKAFKQKE